MVNLNKMFPEVLCTQPSSLLNVSVWRADAFSVSKAALRYFSGEVALDVLSLGNMVQLLYCQKVKLSL